MTDTPAFPDLLSLIDERSAALRAAVAAAPTLDARVPGCPDWTLRALVVHLGEVQRFWAVTVAAGAADGPPPEDRHDTTAPGADLPGWSVASTGRLLTALAAAGPDAPCWTWWGASGAPMTAGAVARHQVQEAAVHAWDARAATGDREPVPAGIAVDAVAEFLGVTLGSGGAWPHRPARIAFAAVEGPSWVVDLTPTGADPFPAASGEPVVTVHGAASDLLLTLFGRIPLDDLRIDGDRTAVEELLAWADTE